MLLVQTEPATALEVTMKKIIFFLFLVILSMAAYAQDGTFGSGNFSEGLFGVESTAQNTLTVTTQLTSGDEATIDSVASNITLVTNSNLTGTINLVEYTSFPSNVSSTPPGSTKSVNRFLDIAVSDEISSNLNYSVIRLVYSDSDISSNNVDESTLRLYKWNGSEWVSFSGSVDTANNFVFANTTSFSTWGIFGNPNPAPAPASSSSGGGGGGGGGGGIYFPQTNESVTYSFNFVADQTYDVNIGPKRHTITVTNISKEKGKAVMIFKSSEKNVELNLGIKSYLNYDDDLYNDLVITLTEVYGGNKVVSVKMTNVHERIQSIGGGSGTTAASVDETPEEEFMEEVPSISDEGASQTITEEPKKQINIKLVAFVVLAIVAVIAIILFYREIRKQRQK